jgi:hypothetical protein
MSAAAATHAVDARVELPAAYSIVRAEVARYTQWLTCREMAAALRLLSSCCVPA